MKRITAALLVLALTPIIHAQPAASPAAAESLPQVQTASVKDVTVYPEREAPAVVRARNTSRLAAETAGQVLRWTAEAGTSVRRGQVLVQLDPRDADLALQQAQAALQSAQTRLKLAGEQLRRARELVAQGFISREALSQRETETALAQADAASARAQLASAQRQKDKTTLRAPFDAQVSERLVQVGETVAPGTPAYVLVETGNPELQATIGASDAQSLQERPAAEFLADGRIFPVKVLRVGSVVQSPARTRLAWFGFPEAAPAPGTSGTLRWRESQPHIAPALMVRRGGTLGIFVMTQAQGAQFVPLPGAQEGRAAPLPAAVGQDARVVIQGQYALKDGQQLKTTHPAAAAGR
ncbi:efflux RND transporter periplasmic adaptor subunit [Hydrogenophaga bisanensis]|uniref:Efflux RND transporter periplasmic adaptor subunit n=1 Tax=Hydrogenophaga bisanensis TaxID=439611 RepID=A0ABW2R5E9_9BURK